MLNSKTDWKAEIISAINNSYWSHKTICECMPKQISMYIYTCVYTMYNNKQINSISQEKSSFKAALQCAKEGRLQYCQMYVPLRPSTTEEQASLPSQVKPDW